MSKPDAGAACDLAEAAAEEEGTVGEFHDGGDYGIESGGEAEPIGRAGSFKEGEGSVVGGDISEAIGDDDIVATRVGEGGAGEVEGRVGGSGNVGAIESPLVGQGRGPERFDGEGVVAAGADGGGFGMSLDEGFGEDDELGGGGGACGVVRDGQRVGGSVVAGDREQVERFVGLSCKWGSIFEPSDSLLESWGPWGSPLAPPGATKRALGATLAHPHSQTPKTKQKTTFPEPVLGSI